jgi:4-amino-4-deoxy-L-arabinose transferase-like glycosyltransferase
MTDHPRWRGGAFVALLLFVWFASTAWIRPLMLPDEGRYAGIAWEMLQSGRWSVPTLDGLPFFHKPPLFYWLSAGAMQLFGVHPWAARMPSVIGATLAALSLFLFARRWGDATQARGAIVVLATQPFFYLGAQFANLDMLVAGCIGATVLLGAHAALLAAEGRPHRAPLVGGYAMAALGMLAKGLIGAVLPGAVLIAWLLAARRPRLLLKLISLPGIALFLLLGLPWFAQMQRLYPGFYDYFVIYHHFKRYAQAGFNNPYPFWFYVPVILLLTLPWSLALPAVWRAREASGARPSIWLLMVCWFAVIVVFFSLPKSKLIGYVLPALPPFAWLLARGLSASLAKPSLLARRAGTLAVIAVLVCVVGTVALAVVKLRSGKEVGLALRAQRQPGEPVLFVKRYAYDVPFYARLEQPVRVLDDWNDPQIPKHDDWRKELWDAGKFAPELGQSRLIGAAALPSLLCSAPRAWIVASAEDLKAMPPLAGAEQVASSRQYALWKLKCPGTPSAGSAGR